MQKEKDSENSEGGETGFSQVKLIDTALYEEVKKRKELERKIIHLKNLLLKQHQKLKNIAHFQEKKEKTKEEIILELKRKHKFTFNPDQYPWMYNIDSIQSEKEKVEWLQEWSNFLFDYAKAFLIHIIDIFGIATEHPFSDFKQNREKYLKEIFNYLASKTAFAEWYNKEKTRLRIYWRSLDEWSEHLYDCMYLNGIEIATLIDIKNFGEEIADGFATLQARDIKKIIDILVKNKKATWIDKKAIKFLFV